MQTIEVKLGEWIQGGFDLYKENLGLLLLANLLAAVIGLATCYVLLGPMMAGVILLTMRLHEKTPPKPEVGMIFKGFDFFLPSLLVIVSVVGGALALVWLPLLGQLLAALYVIAASTFLLFAMVLIVDKKMDFQKASQTSIEIVKQNFWMFLAFAVVLGIISWVGFLLCIVGVVLTIPLYCCTLVVAYREIISRTVAPQG
jgi:uncharacterized membrane protein